jgi:hypothetical protein
MWILMLLVDVDVDVVVDVDVDVVVDVDVGFCSRCGC